MIATIIVSVVLGGSWGLLMSVLFEQPLSIVLALLGGLLIGMIVGSADL